MESSRNDSIVELDMVGSVDLFIYLFTGPWTKKEGRTDIKKYKKIKVGGEV